MTNQLLKALHRTVDQYQQKKSAKEPNLHLNLKSPTNREGFSIRLDGSNIYVDSANYASAIFGLNTFLKGIKSGHWVEMQGEWLPEHSQRILWIGGHKQSALTDQIFLSVPDLMWKIHDDAFMEGFCLRILELGYNAVLLGVQESQKASVVLEQSFDFQGFISILHAYGLKVIIKPFLKHPDEWQAALEYLHQMLTFDGLFWESTWQLNIKNRHLLQKDYVYQEISELEEILNTPLIYYIPTQTQMKWLPDLCNDIKKNTTIAFSAVAGNFYEDHLPPHPIWRDLRREVPLHLPLMPIINTGSVAQGEGLWPGLTSDLIERLTNISGLPGAIITTCKLPSAGAFLDCNLWMAGQILWKTRPLYSLLETWMQTNKPAWEVETLHPLLKTLRDIQIKIGQLKSLREGPEARLLAEHIDSAFKLLKNQKEQAKMQFPELFTYFAVDADRLTSNLVHKSPTGLLFQRQDDEPQEGFWTQKGNPDLLAEPQRGEAGSLQAKLFDESRTY